jgi:hypothetical protein
MYTLAGFDLTSARFAPVFFDEDFLKFSFPFSTGPQRLPLPTYVKLHVR